MATGIGSPLALGGLYPSVDGRYVAANGKPFTSVSNAESALNGFPSKLVESCVGLTVLVKESGWTEAKEYWVQPKGTTPETYGLVDKHPQIDTSGFATKTEVNAKQDALPSGTAGQILKKTINSVEWGDMPSIEDGENTAVTLDGAIHVSAVDAQEGDGAGVEITPHIGGGVDMKFTLPKGADGQDGARGNDAVNPFKGYYPSGVSLPATGAVGDYLYAPPSDSQSTATATIWHYDSTQTPPWADTEIDVSDVVGVEFANTSKPVAQTYVVNDLITGGTTDVLSAEAGKKINTSIGVINMDKDYPLTSGNYYQCSDASAPNYVPTVLLNDVRKKQGLIVVFSTSYNSNLVYIFNGMAQNEPSWKLSSNWKQIPIDEISFGSALYKYGQPIYNLTVGIPLDSGYYQFLDANEANFAPNAIPQRIRERGLVVAIEVSQYNWELYQFQSTTGGWQAPYRWKKIGGTEINVIDNLNSTSTTDALSAKQGKVLNEKILSSSIVNINREYGSISTYLQCTDDTLSTFAPSLIPLSRRNLGCIITFRNSNTDWEIYQYVGGDISDTYWNTSLRWKFVGENRNGYDLRQVWIKVDHTNWTMQYLTVPVSMKIDLKSNGTFLNLLIPQKTQNNTENVGFYIRSLANLKVNGTLYPVVDINGNTLNTHSVTQLNKYYQFLWDGTNFVLLNPDNFEELFPVIEENYNFYSNGDLELGGISTNGADTISSNRIRTKRGIFYKAPLKVRCTSGYKVIYIFNYGATTDESVIATGKNAASVDILTDGYYRLIFGKSDGSDISELSDVGGIVVESNFGNGVHESMDLTNVENIMAIGTSHMQGNGSIKGKSFASYLSELYDWNIVNCGCGGANYIDQLNAIQRNLSTNYHIPDVNNGGIVLDFANGGAEPRLFNPPYDGNYTVDNIKRVYAVLRSKGFEIIPCMYFGDHIYGSYIMQADVAKQMGLRTININSECKRTSMLEVPPYNYNAHFATRTVATQWYPFLKAAKLRRPRTAIKIFRNRGIESNNEELLYNNIFEKIKYWSEIQVNHNALPNDKNNYVDRLDLFQANGYHLIPIDSEYAILRGGSTITVGDKALVEFVIPCTCNGVKNLKFHFGISSSPTVYIRKYIDEQLSIYDLSNPSVVFDVSGGTSGISVGDTFTCANYSGVTFTVTAKDDTIVVASSSDTTISFPGSIETTISVNGNSYNVTKITRGVPSNYSQKIFSPYSMWEAITLENGVAVVSDPSKYMDYDKVSFLIDNDGTDFTLGELNAEYDVLFEKEKNLYFELDTNELQDGQWHSVINDLFTLNGTTVGAHGTLVGNNGSENNNGYLTYIDSNNETKIVSVVPAYYRNEIHVEKALKLRQGDKVTYSIQGLKHDGGEPLKHFRVKITARYAVDDNLNPASNSFTVTPTSFDMARLGVRVDISGYSSQELTNPAVYTKELYVPAAFVELETDIYADARCWPMLELEAIDDNIEIIYIEVLEDVANS